MKAYRPVDIAPAALVCFAALVILTTLRMQVVHASGPIAIYARVDKVEFEPNAEKPDRILVRGVFIMAGKDPGVYSAPQAGYIYCALPAPGATMPGGAWQIAANATDLARIEWNDLKAVAGTRQVVGFGSTGRNDAEKLRIRKPDEKPNSPDEYPIGNGVGKINADQPRARALLDFKER